MQVNISNTSQSLILNSYYIHLCENKDKLLVNKKVDSEFNQNYMMSLVRLISERLQTKIIKISNHKFLPSGTSMNVLVESAETFYGSSGVAHLNESHISFHSYFENSIDGVCVLRLELHISSCSRNSVFHSLDVLSNDSKYCSFNAITIDYFHRGINLENISPDREYLETFIQRIPSDRKLFDSSKSKNFEHIKIFKNADHDSNKNLYEKVFLQIADYLN